MDLGYLTIGALGGYNFVGHAGARKIGPHSALVCIWDVVGVRLDDQSGARRAAAILARMACRPRWACLPRFRRKATAMETRCHANICGHSVLRALDDPQLHRFSSLCSVAFKPAL